MKATDFNLAEMRHHLQRALQQYTFTYDHILTFRTFENFTLPDNGRYSAQTSVPLSFGGFDLGYMKVIAFLYGDGTGDTSTYALDSIMIPDEFEIEGRKPERLIPRAKSNPQMKVICEGYFPLFSTNDVRETTLCAGSLDELIVKSDPLRVDHGWVLGQAPDVYDRALASTPEPRPRGYYTVGMSPSGERFGDPHAIYSGRNKNVLQVAGFLSITNPAAPIADLTKTWIYPTRLSAP